MNEFRGRSGSGRNPGNRTSGPTCEVCGGPVRTPFTVQVDGAVLRVCQNCSRVGRPVQVQARPVHVEPVVRRIVTTPTPPPRAARRDIEPEFDIDPDYAITVRHAREKMGLTQEALGRMINVKPSVIHHVETGKMKPDLILARTLMHSLRVNLLVSSDELDSGAR